ncbi:MAG: hypothetical protein OXU71_09535 [Gammaproteobacteria bacterium]|nr:hypothetical protein [Gammaproteobacteria bacterium]MDD9822640.1 hypothetical protein [Gammaproteobacteria bacterium]MDD9884916.1 hypothetical protein [Gammaproteobacteria bacterium]
MAKQQPEENIAQFPITPEMAEAHWAMLYVDDAQFRADFDKDPRAAIGRLTGETVPDDVEVVVHRRKPGQIHLVLPEAVDESGGLSAEQLGRVSAAMCYKTAPTNSWGSYRPVIDHSTGRPVYEHSNTGPRP